MKPLSEEELAKCAEDAWQKTSFMAISHDAFIAAYKQGYAKCGWQMADEFNNLISVFETLYCRTNERRREMKRNGITIAIGILMAVAMLLVIGILTGLLKDVWVFASIVVFIIFIFVIILTIID